MAPSWASPWSGAVSGDCSVSGDSVWLMFGSFPWSSVRARAAAVRGAKVRRGTPLRPLPGLAAAWGPGRKGRTCQGWEPIVQVFG
ncbi:hypothetical protein Kosp01_09850 [Kocuria sp. NBRC 114282]|nr:hypothetical protein Kosp01_09850 [Kocuria sp. NBRC 114282]